MAMRLSALQLALPPRRIQTRTDGGAADSIRNVLHLEHFQGRLNRRCLMPYEACGRIFFRQQLL